MQGSDTVYQRMAAQTFYKETPIDQELESKVKRVADKLSETVNIVANEPSLAFFRIQEHVRKTLPQLVDQKHEVEDIQTKVQGACFDTEYASNAVRGMLSSAIHFQNIQDLLKNAMFMKQQINYGDNKRKFGRRSPAAVVGQGDKGRDGEAPRGDASNGTSAQSRHSTNSSVNTSNYLLNEALNVPKKSLEDSDDGKEVEELMSRMPGPEKGVVECSNVQ